MWCQMWPHHQIHYTLLYNCYLRKTRSWDGLIIQVYTEIELGLLVCIFKKYACMTTASPSSSLNRRTLSMKFLVFLNICHIVITTGFNYCWVKTLVQRYTSNVIYFELLFHMCIDTPLILMGLLCDCAQNGQY